MFDCDKATITDVTYTAYCKR